MDKTTDQYMYALRKARKYSRKSKEIEWDRAVARRRQIAIKERKGVGDIAVPRHAKPPSKSLQILAQELKLQSDSSSDDMDYVPLNQQRAQALLTNEVAHEVVPSTNEASDEGLPPTNKEDEEIVRPSPHKSHSFMRLHIIDNTPEEDEEDADGEDETFC